MDPSGYLAGQSFQSSFDGPEFREALSDKNERERVWSYKMQLARAELNLDSAAKDLNVLKDSGGPAEGKALKMEKEIQKEYAVLFKADPDLIRFRRQP